MCTSQIYSFACLSENSDEKPTKTSLFRLLRSTRKPRIASVGTWEVCIQYPANLFGLHEEIGILMTRWGL